MQDITNPSWMTFDQQMKEAARILAAGIMRRRRRQMIEMETDPSVSLKENDLPTGKNSDVTDRLPQKGTK